MCTVLILVANQLADVIAEMESGSRFVKECHRGKAGIPLRDTGRAHICTGTGIWDAGKTVGITVSFHKKWRDGRTCAIRGAIPTRCVYRIELFKVVDVKICVSPIVIA